MIRGPRASALLFFMATVAAAGCRRRPAPTELEVPAPVAPAPPVPVDRTLPDELAEGSEKAFGLPIPRIMTVRGRYVDVVYAGGQVTADRVANYVRQRVSTGDKVETGPAKTLFPRATVRGQPGVQLAIQVTSHGTATELSVRNLSRNQPSPGLTEEERWRAAGLKPDGTLLDPTHLR